MIILMINIKTLLLLAIVAIIAVSCAKIFSKGNKTTPLSLNGYANVDANEFTFLVANTTVQLLDVRTQEEFDEGHIAGARLIDVNDTAFVEKAKAVLDAAWPVAVYCRSGRRSARAASLLTAQGFKVTNLAGGVIAWQDAGMTLVK